MAHVTFTVMNPASEVAEAKSVLGVRVDVSFEGSKCIFETLIQMGKFGDGVDVICILADDVRSAPKNLHERADAALRRFQTRI
jgi:hypothetical protein